MKWYWEKAEELGRTEPVISACGDDCAVCPRFLARTEAELRETAELWYRFGWRDRVVSNEEIRCEGCGSRSGCSFGILPCRKEQGVADCAGCVEYPCGRIRALTANTDGKAAQYRKLCDNEAELALLTRAFLEKGRNQPQK